MGEKKYTNCNKTFSEIWKTKSFIQIQEWLSIIVDKNGFLGILNLKGLSYKDSKLYSVMGEDFKVVLG